MANGGEIASRGFIFQAVVALIECLDPDNDWDQIKNEPNTDEDKVDIMLYKDGRTKSAIQVKSSINAFKRADVEKWLESLKGDAKDAENVCLYLVGDTFTPSCENYLNENPDEIKRIPFEHLQRISTGTLVGYINRVGLGEKVRVTDLDLIDASLFSEILRNSIARDPVSRGDFEAIFQKAIPHGEELEERIIEAVPGFVHKDHVIPKLLTLIPLINKGTGLIGRDDVVKDIRKMLEENTCIVLVNGLGGIGKTAVMQGICNDVKDEGYYVAWISCGDSLRDDLLMLRDILGVPKEEKADTAYSLVIFRIQQLGKRLYLFLDDLSREVTRKERDVINGLGVHVMITSRAENLPFRKIKLDSLDEESAIKMFYGYYGGHPGSEETVKQIIRSVNYNTMLVEMLAKAAAIEGGTLEEFWYNLKVQGIFDVSRWNFSTKDKIRTIEECVMELYKISELSSAQQHIMKLFTIFTPEKEIFYKISEWAGFDRNELKKLVGLGWLEQGGLENGYYIHQIVKDSIARQMKRAGEKVRLEEYGDFLGNVIDTDSYVGKEITYDKVRERLVLAENVAGFFDEIDRKDEEAGTLFNNMAGVYHSQGNYGKALAFYEKALAIREKLLGMNHPDTATTYNNLAGVYHEQGNYDKAMEFFEKARVIRENVLGMEHPDTAATYNNMAGVYKDQGDYDKAMEFFEKARVIKENVLGMDHPDTAITYNNMARMYHDQDDYEKALAFYEKSLIIREKMLGKNHPDTAATYYDMAGVYKDQGEYEKSLEYCRKALDIYKQVLGKEHQTTTKARKFLQEIITKDTSQGHTEKSLEDFFHEYNDSYPSFADLQQFVKNEHFDIIQSYPHSGISDIFRFAEVQKTDHLEDLELLELLWKLYLVDSGRIDKTYFKVISNANHLPDSNSIIEKNPEINETNLSDALDTKDDTSYKPEPSDLEEATKLVLEDFENWWEEEVERDGLTFSIEKHAKRQSSGSQFGYDVGLNSKIGELKYRLRFECKNYTSNISDKNSAKVPDLIVRNYAYNMLEYYMDCDSKVNNRWVLVCPFGGLQNNFPEHLFERWNEDHDFIKIFAIMEDGPSLKCKDFLSANEQAYDLVYKSTYDGPYTKDGVFKYLYEKIIGTDNVREAMLERLSHYSFWEEYRGHNELLPVPNRKKEIALDQLLNFLQSKKESIENERKKTLFIIGEYGTGKSWLCYQAIEQIVLHPGYYRLMPFYLRLKVLSRNKDWNDETRYKSIMNNTLKEYYKMYDKWAGECVQKSLLPVFFLDGFDEVFSGLSSTEKKIDFLLRIIYELKDWYKRYENERGRHTHVEPMFIITSRESDFEMGMKSESFHQQMESAEILELEMCSVEEIQKEWNKLEQTNHNDGSWLLQLEQNSAFLNIIRRPVFFSLCSNATKSSEFNRKVTSSLVNEADVLDMLFEYDLENYAHSEEISKEDLRKEIYRCAVKCSKEKKSEVLLEGRSINEVIHVGIVKIRKDQEREGTCWVSFEHNIVREYLTARYLCQLLIDSSKDEIENPLNAAFIMALRDLSLTPEAIKLLLLCIEKRSRSDNGDCYKRRIKKWLCNDNIKKSDSPLPARLLEILLQPGYTLSGESGARLDLSELHANNICLWKCTMRHINFHHAVLKNWQMINVELDDIDLRCADISGLRIAPDDPISNFCFWKESRKWNVAALHKHGQLMKYSFPEDSLEQHTAEVLSKNKCSGGVIRFGNEFLLHSLKNLYDQEERELYHFRSSKELRQIVTLSGLCGIILEQNDECHVVIFQEDAATAYAFIKVDPRRICIAENGNIIYVQDGSINLIDQNGKSKRLCKWEKNYECFSLRIEPSGESSVYIKCKDKMIWIDFDKNMNEKVSSRKELQIQGDLETMRELRILNENSLVAVGDANLFIMSLSKNQKMEELRSRKIKTGILIKNSLLEDEGGLNRVGDEKAYILLSTCGRQNPV